MAVFKSLTFDGINSLDYGIYITGEAVYNAPERAVEMVTIPGRNGALAIDQGYFENIEVSYPCGCFADTQADFAEKVSAFRNAIGSRYSYKRLTDEYNTDEYRLGLYKSGLEVSAVRYGTAGQFTITFDCKPQRFLIDGDTELEPTDYKDLRTKSGSIVQITNDGTLGVKSVLTTIEPIQSGSGTPSPDNVRPISGHTECVTSVSGVNVWDEEWEVGDLRSDNGGNYPATNRIRSKNYIPLLPNTTYYFKSPNNSFFCFYDADKKYTNIGNNTIYGNATFTTKENTHFMRISLLPSYGTVYNNDISINYPSTDHDYHAYNGNTYTTSLGRTVYGGTLDVVSGVLTVDRAMVTFDGTEDWNAYGSGSASAFAMRIEMSNLARNNEAVTASNYLEPVPSNATWGNYDALASSTLSQPWIVAGIKTITTVNDWKAYLAQNPLQICYELATPQTYQLTPTEVELLLGTNNLWTDCGDSTAEYGIPPYYNPTEFDAKPLIKITGSGNVAIGSQLISVTDIPNTTTVYIDCDTMEIYTLSGGIPSGASSHVSFNGNDFPVLPSGLSKVTYTTRGVSIAPRWWRI